MVVWGRIRTGVEPLFYRSISRLSGLPSAAITTAPNMARTSVRAGEGKVKDDATLTY
jgi:hypothetical protein